MTQSPDSDASDLVARLEELGYQVTPPAKQSPKPKPPACSICDKPDMNQVWRGERVYDLSEIDDDTELAEWLTKIRVEVNDSGEEGWDIKELLLCEDHEQYVITGLIQLGFGTHHHGSTHPLSDERCPGSSDARKCPGARKDAEWNHFPSPYDD